MLVHCILHHGRIPTREEADFFLPRAIQALHLSAAAGRLLCLYAGIRNRFRPSARWIACQIGVQRRDVFRLRQQLVDTGCVSVCGCVIQLDWNQLRVFSTMDAAMTARQRGHACFHPAYPVVGRESRHRRELRRIWEQTGMCMLVPSFDDFVAFDRKAMRLAERDRKTVYGVDEESAQGVWDGIQASPDDLLAMFPEGCEIPF